MKKIINIFFYIFTSIILLVSFVMTILELRLLISGDFLLCDNGFNGFVRYYLRLIICLSFLSVSIFELFKIYNKVEFVKKHLLFLEILLLLSSFVILLYGTNYVGIVTFVITFVFVGLKLLKEKVK